MRYFVRLSYFGKNFNGWQVQPNAPSVQEALNNTLSVILNNETYLVGAGRTDTGVHAREMYAHFDFDGELPENLVHRWNSFAGRDIAIKDVFRVPDTAHARFDALSREYEYRIILEKDPFLQDLAWFLYRNPDVDKMKEAAAYLFDYEDFSSFSKSRTQTKTNNCKIMKADWHKEGSLLIFTLKADRFLRNMVRAVVGTLVEIGMGKKDPAAIRSVIESKDRKLAGESAPAHGLYLTRVEYPQTILKWLKVKV